MFKRFAPLADSAADDAGEIRMLASTDAPVRMGDWQEVLVHADGAVDMSATRALLVNHDPNQIAGTLRSCMVDGRACSVHATVSKAARLQSGMGVLEAVRSGALRGVSIGYTYSRGDTTWNKETRTLTVNRWRLLEVTLTPIPADSAASVRSLPFDEQHDPAAPEKENRMSETAPAPAPSVDADAIRNEAREVAVLARSLGLDADKFVGLPREAAQRDMLAAVAANRANPVPVAAVVPATITRDATDKAREAVVEAYAGRVMGETISGNPYAGRSIRGMAKRYASAIGIDTRDWDNKDEAHFALGEMNATPRLRDAANVTTSSFASFVFLDAITKVVAKGYEAGGQNLVYPVIAEKNVVPDFKASKIGGLGMGNLEETVENVAFPELAKSEGVFSSTAKMWGGTVSLTLQALISDDTGSFDRQLRQAGAIAQKTKEKRAIQKFLRGTATTDASTWTNNTTSGSTLVYTSADTIAAARANIYRASVGMMNKIGSDGNPLGTIPKFLLCGPTNSLFARGLLQNVGGQIVANSGDLQMLVSPYLELSTITGNSTTSYYLIADPMVATGLLETVITGYENVQVQEYDAGAVGARKFKLWLPFEFDLFSMANSAGTTIIPAAQQATT